MARALKVPFSLRPKKKLTDPYTSPGKLEKGLKKKAQKGWSN